MAVLATRGNSLVFWDGSAAVKSMRSVGTIPGVVIDEIAGRNGTGLGWIKNEGGSPARIRWKAPGGTQYGPPINVSEDGSHLLEDGDDRDKWLAVTVYTDHLVSGSESRVLIQDRYNNEVAADDESGSEVEIEYELTLKNQHPTLTARDILVWNPLPSAPIDLSTDGLSYSDYSTEAGALGFGDLAPGATVTVYALKYGPTFDPPVEGVPDLSAILAVSCEMDE